MKSPQQIIDELTPEQKARIVLDFEDFRNEVRVDDSELRRVAAQMAAVYSTPVSTWLDFVGHAVSHDLAKEYAHKILSPAFDLQSAVDSLEESKNLPHHLTLKSNFFGSSTHPTTTTQTTHTHNMASFLSTTMQKQRVSPSKDNNVSTLLNCSSVFKSHRTWKRVFGSPQANTLLLR